MTADPKEIQTSLAAEIPPLELDHKQAYELLLNSDPKTLSDPDFDKLVVGYREERRQRAAKMLERNQAKQARERKKAEAAAKRLEREAKKAAKVAAKDEDETNE